jgi:hypothetical protein
LFELGGDLVMGKIAEESELNRFPLLGWQLIQD